MKTPILETERLILRPLTIADADAVFSGWASDPEVNKYMSYALHETINTTIEWLTHEEKNIDSDEYFSWGFVLKENGKLIGSGGCGYDKKHKMFAPGYNIMKVFWGKGLTTEALRAIIDFAVSELGAREFFCNHATENIASGKVMEKVGFVYQKDGEFKKLDGSETFQSREYLLII